MKVISVIVGAGIAYYLKKILTENDSFNILFHNRKVYHSNQIKINKEQFNDVIHNSLETDFIHRHLSSNSTEGVTHEASKAHHNIFNSLNTLTVTIATISVLIIIASVFLVEFFFDKLSELADDTPFRQLLIAIEKELMVIGCMAFIFKIISNLNVIESESWIFALEYAGLIKILKIVCFLLLNLLKKLILVLFQIC